MGKRNAWDVTIWDASDDTYAVRGHLDTAAFRDAVEVFDPHATLGAVCVSYFAHVRYIPDDEGGYYAECIKASGAFPVTIGRFIDNA